MSAGGDSEAGLACLVITHADNPRVQIDHIGHGRTIQDLVSLQRKPVVVYNVCAVPVICSARVVASKMKSIL